MGKANPFRYRGYYYDEESGLYEIGSRYYDPLIGRFVNADSAMGVNADMATYNLYVYCGNNPITRFDVGGMFWKEIWEGAKNIISTVIHAGNNIAVSIGIDTAAIGAVVLNMTKDGDGIYHANFDCWQAIFGYNDLYDIAFDIGTDMATAKFPFTYNGQEYIFWAWKGDYINLGAGAEMGIYYGGDPHWQVDKGLAMPMAMWLSYKGSKIITYTGGGSQWWCTGFNPAYRNVKASDLTATFSIRFRDPGMYRAFYGAWNEDSRWTFWSLQGFGLANFTF